MNRCHENWLSRFPATPISTEEVDREVIFEDIPVFILADSAYANTKHMIMTFGMTECNADPVIVALNRKLGGA